jgi:hypothetical protein
MKRAAVPSARGRPDRIRARPNDGVARDQQQRTRV